MNRIILTAAVALLGTGAAFAQEGDVAAGEKDFRKCKACHAIIDDAGEVIVKGGKTGPNLYGIIGRQAGTYPDFNYGDSIVELGEAGLVWTEEEVVEYLLDPRKYLQTELDDSKAKSKMTFKLKDGADVAAYLASLAPAPEAEGEDDAEGESDG